jgi:hypothetical protein
MKLLKFSFLIAACLFAATISQAKDSSAEDATKHAQDILRDEKKLNEIIKSDPKAQAVNGKVHTVVNNDEEAKEIYSISADILPIFMEMHQDNPEKALDALSSYSKDPGAFLKSMPANVRERIEKLAKKIESSGTKASTNKP